MLPRREALLRRLSQARDEMAVPTIRQLLLCGMQQGEVGLVPLLSDTPRRVVAAGFLVAAFAWSLNFYAPFVLAFHMQQVAGWSAFQASAPVTTHFLVSAAVLWGLDSIHRRVGVRTALCCGFLMSSAGIIAWATATHASVAQMAAIATGVGWALTGSAAIAALVRSGIGRAEPWALATALNGATVGGLIFTPLFVFLIDVWSLSVAASAVGLAAVSCPILLVVLLQRDRQSSLTAGRQATYWALVRDPRYLKLGAAFSLFVFSQIGVAAHLLNRMAEAFDAMAAAQMMSLALASGIVGRWTMAWCLVRVDCRRAAALNFILQGAAIATMAVGQSQLVLLGACIAYGLTIGNSIVLLPVIVQDAFGAADSGKIVASLSSVNQLALAIAPASVAVAFDLVHSYMLPFLGLALLQVVGVAIISWPIAPTRPARV